MQISENKHVHKKPVIYPDVQVTFQISIQLTNVVIRPSRFKWAAGHSFIQNTPMKGFILLIHLSFTQNVADPVVTRRLCKWTCFPFSNKLTRPFPSLLWEINTNLFIYFSVEFFFWIRITKVLINLHVTCVKFRKFYCRNYEFNFTSQFCNLTKF